MKKHCQSEYDTDIKCQKIKGHKGPHESTKYWTDD